MNDLKAAVAHLEAMAQNAIGAAADADMPEQQKTALWAEYKELDTALTALRSHVPDTGLKGCWHCRNIEAHHIEYVTAVKAKGGTPMNMPVDCPYHYCPACGRKLEVEG